MEPLVSQAKENPTRTFARPADVLEADELSCEEKLAILKNWENEAHLLQTATEENMGGGEGARLEEVREAIDRLARTTGIVEPHKAVPTKT